MAHYYRLMAGLPDLSADTQKLPMSQEEFYLELTDELSRRDLELLDWLRLESLNKAFAQSLKDGLIEPIIPSEDEEETPQAEADEDEEGNTPDNILPLEELRQIATLAHRGQPRRRSELVPGYVVHFLNTHFAPKAKSDDEDEDEAPESAEQTLKGALSIEDQLSGGYYMSGMRSKNAFLAEWFRFNYILRNILVVYTCRKLGWQAEDYVVGNNEISERLLTSKAKDFELGEEFPWVSQVLSIAEESDISKRERMIDVLRWRWLEEQTFARVFDIESVLTYYIRLGIIERWLKLDPKTGEEVFRQIVMGLKRESNASLQAFRERTNK